jgi:hypothetical protein
MILAQPLDDNESLQTLKTLIDSAGSVLADLIEDPLFARLTRAFAGIPRAERETILGVLERELQVRRNIEAAGDIVGLTLRPNPKARLYTRVIVDPPQLDRAVAIVNTLRAIRTLHEAVEPTDGEWRNIAREALRALGDAERASTARFAAEVVQLVEECTPR